MRKAIFVMLLGVVCGSAMAEWVKLGSAGAANNSYDFYAEINTIRRTGDMAKLWVMYDYYDYKAAQGPDNVGKRYLSHKAQHEYDCKDERIRVLYYVLHSENMGRGNVVDSFGLHDGLSSNWSPIVPQSVAEGFWLFVCRKR